jgi:type I restriction enzyme M protein
MKEMKMTYEELNKEVWNVANELKGNFRDDTIATICIVFTLLRRIDCMLRPYNSKVVSAYKKLIGRADENGLDAELTKATGGRAYYNKSGIDFDALLADENNFASKFSAYLDAFSPLVKEIFEGFQLNQIIFTLNKTSLLRKVFDGFCALDLSEEIVDGDTLADFVYSLAQKKDVWGEVLNDKSGLVDTLLANLVAIKGKSEDGSTIYDPTCGSCHTLLMAKEAIGGKGEIYGQDINNFAVALTRTMAILKGEEDLIHNIRTGNTLTDDKFPQARFDNIVANMPFGMDWKSIYREMQAEAKRPETRFFAGLPALNDSQFLFIQHILTKMSDKGRACFLTNSSPLYVGGPKSTENEVRKRLITYDMLDCLVYLHSPLTNTRINVVIWVIDNNKSEARKGNVQIINVKSDDVNTILKAYHDFQENEYSHIIPNDLIGEFDITVVRPDGIKFRMPVPVNADIDEYFKKEILPYIDSESTIDCSRILRDYSFHIDDFEDDEVRKPEVVEEELYELETRDVSSSMLSEPAPRRYSEIHKNDYRTPILGLLMEPQNNNELPHPGDILIKTTDGQMHIFKEDEELPKDLNQYLVVKAKDMILPEYLVIYSQTKMYKHDLALYSNNIVMMHVSMRILMHMRIPLPTLGEQKMIIDKNHHLQEKVDCMRRQLELMEEYRQSVMEYSINLK